VTFDSYVGKYFNGISPRDVWHVQPHPLPTTYRYDTGFLGYFVTRRTYWNVDLLLESISETVVPKYQEL
jgi:hypothetical protein